MPTHPRMRRNGLLECDCGAAVVKTTERGFVCVGCGQPGERTAVLEPNSGPGTERNTPAEPNREPETGEEPETDVRSEPNWIPGPSL